MTILRVGVIGSADPINFNTALAREMLSTLLTNLKNTGVCLEVVSGLKKVGAYEVAYLVAKDLSIPGTAIAPKAHVNGSGLPWDAINILGKFPGDEIAGFLNAVDIVVAFKSRQEDPLLKKAIGRAYSLGRVVHEVQI